MIDFILDKFIIPVLLLIGIVVILLVCYGLFEFVRILITEGITA